MSYFSYIYFFPFGIRVDRTVCGKLLELLMKVKPISALAMTFSTRTVCQPTPGRENRGGGKSMQSCYIHAQKTVVLSE